MSQNDPFDRRLTPKQTTALVALLAGYSMQSAASSAGVTPKTLYRWRRDPAFAAELRDGEAELVNSALRTLQTLTRPAVLTCGAVLSDTTARTADKLRAASIILSTVLELKNLVDLEARVSALEAGVHNESE